MTPTTSPTPTSATFHAPHYHLQLQFRHLCLNVFPIFQSNERSKRLLRSSYRDIQFLASQFHSLRNRLHLLLTRGHLLRSTLLLLSQLSLLPLVVPNVSNSHR